MPLLCTRSSLFQLVKLKPKAYQKMLKQVQQLCRHEAHSGRVSGSQCRLGFAVTGAALTKNPMTTLVLFSK